MPYSTALRIRNRRYDEHRLESHRVPVPVICIGNLTLGGTGKTPMVEYVANWFRQRDVRVAIVSRGYGAAKGEPNDEARELSLKLPSVPHVQNRDRVAAAKTAVDEFDAQLVLMDDGFQHRQLHRDLDVVLIDALEPFGFNHVFPRGMLRESVEGLRRAQLVVLSRADMVTAAERQAIRDRVLTIAPQTGWAEVAHVATSLHSGMDHQRESDHSLEQLHSRRVLAFCGIGNPHGFRNTLAATGATILDFREFPDHHPYSARDLEALEAWTSDLGPDMVICTHKDLVKLEIDQLAGVPLRALTVKLGVLDGEAELTAALSRIRGMIP